MTELELYVWNEGTPRASRIWVAPVFGADIDQYRLWGRGTKSELIARAIGIRQIESWRGVAGSDTYADRCAVAVLRHLGAQLLGRLVHTDRSGRLCCEPVYSVSEEPIRDVQTRINIAMAAGAETIRWEPAYDAIYDIAPEELEMIAGE